MKDWKSKAINDSQILYWNNLDHIQVLEDSKNRSGGCYLGSKGGLWSSNAQTVRQHADKSFIGRNEYVDDHGVVWYMNLFIVVSNGKDIQIMCKNDAGEEKELFEVLGIYGFKYRRMGR